MSEQEVGVAAAATNTTEMYNFGTGLENDGGLQGVANILFVFGGTVLCGPPMLEDFHSLALGMPDMLQMVR